MGDLQTGRDRARQATAVGWGGLSFTAWPAGWDLLQAVAVGWDLLQPTHRINHRISPSPRREIFVLHNRKPQKIFRGEREIFVLQTENPKEQRAKRKERAEKRESREKKREKFSEQKAVGTVGSDQKILIF